MTEPNPVTGFAPAKVNLSLHVTGRRADGYHLLDSLVAFADFGDHLTLHPGSEMSVRVSGPFAPGVPTDSRNLVWRAAEAMGWRGTIDLQKDLPHAAGIGGGSSDAAGVLRALSGQGTNIDPATVLELGADVPVCMAASGARMTGIGEDVVKVVLPKLPVLLLNPKVAVPTGAVFSGLESRENPAMPSNIPTFSGPEDCAKWLKQQRNDLEAPAKRAAPAIADALAALGRTRNVLMARMSGSGATCFAIYPSLKDAQFAAYDIETAEPDWWCRAATLQ